MRILDDFSPIEVAIALSLYGFNVSPMERAKAIYDFFEGDCAELDTLVWILRERVAFVATELDYPSAEVYVSHALERYGAEAKERCKANE